MSSSRSPMAMFVKAFGPQRCKVQAVRSKPKRTLDVTEREWRRLRAAVFARDRYTCVYCDATPPVALLQADHVKARASGGLSTMDNLVTSCGPCNASKRAIPLEQWRPSA